MNDSTGRDLRAGDRVHFAHQTALEGHTVQAITADGRVQLVDLVGDFAADVFVLIAARPTHLDRFRDIVGRIQYKNDWRFLVAGERGRYTLQVEFDAPDRDVVGACYTPQRGRKWLLSAHMTDSEIVQTAFMAVLAAEEHEARESFRVEGVAVLAPHFDLFALVAFKHAGMLPLDARAPQELEASPR